MPSAEGESHITAGNERPAISNNMPSSSGPQPVLLAEILDQDTVVEFYEDYAKLAFGGPGSASSRGKLLKYRTKEDISAASVDDNPSQRGRKRSGSQKQEMGIKMEDGGIRGEAGITRLGEEEGAVDVTYVWQVRRDVFEVPMLIIMNVSAHLTFVICRYIS